METSLLICIANRWTGFCMVGTSVIKELDLTIELNPQIFYFVGNMLVWLLYQYINLSRIWLLLSPFERSLL